MTIQSFVGFGLVGFKIYNFFYLLQNKKLHCQIVNHQKLNWIIRSLGEIKIFHINILT